MQHSFLFLSAAFSGRFELFYRSLPGFQQTPTPAHPAQVAQPDRLPACCPSTPISRMPAPPLPGISTIPSLSSVLRARCVSCLSLSMSNHRLPFENVILWVYNWNRNCNKLPGMWYFVFGIGLCYPGCGASRGVLSKIASCLYCCDKAGHNVGWQRRFPLRWHGLKSLGSHALESVSHSPVIFKPRDGFRTHQVPVWSVYNYAATYDTLHLDGARTEVTGVQGWSGGCGWYSMFFLRTFFSPGLPKIVSQVG